MNVEFDIERNIAILRPECTLTKSCFESAAMVSFWNFEFPGQKCVFGVQRRFSVSTCDLSSCVWFIKSAFSIQKCVSGDHHLCLRMFDLIRKLYCLFVILCFPTKSVCLAFSVDFLYPCLISRLVFLFGNLALWSQKYVFGDHHFCLFQDVGLQNPWTHIIRHERKRAMSFESLILLLVSWARAPRPWWTSGPGTKRLGPSVGPGPGSRFVCWARAQGSVGRAFYIEVYNPDAYVGGHPPVASLIPGV